MVSRLAKINTHFKSSQLRFAMAPNSIMKPNLMKFATKEPNNKKKPTSFHIGAPIGEGKFAEVCLSPGDPLRAKWVAETFLTDVEEINTIRNMLGYTGWFNGTKISVMATGTGMPSACIYWHEMITQYGVKTIIRIGTCGGLKSPP